MRKDPRLVTLRTAETIDNEAADWLTKLDGGELSNRGRALLREWLARDPEHGHALKRLASIWHEMDVLLNDFAPLDGGSSHPHVIPRPRPKRWRMPALVMICLGIVTLSAWMVTTYGPRRPAESYYLATTVGAQRVESLSDGSSAHLNTDSVIETEFSDTLRIVRLLRGEALFDVRHDPQRPFVVYVGNSQVKAIGTRFVVRMTSKSIVVTVTDGQVQLSKRVSDGSVPAELQVTKAQEVIVVSQGEEVELGDQSARPKLKPIESEELSRRLSWTDGQLVFKNETLAYVISEIGRYVPTSIIINDPMLRDVRISGRFAVGDTDALLEAIEVSLNVRVSYSDSETIYLSR